MTHEDFTAGIAELTAAFRATEPAPATLDSWYDQLHRIPAKEWRSIVRSLLRELDIMPRNIVPAVLRRAPAPAPDEPAEFVPADFRHLTPDDLAAAKSQNADILRRLDKAVFGGNTAHRDRWMGMAMAAYVRLGPSHEVETCSRVVARGLQVPERVRWMEHYLEHPHQILWLRSPTRGHDASNSRDKGPRIDDRMTTNAQTRGERKNGI